MRWSPHGPARRRRPPPGPLAHAEAVDVSSIAAVRTSLVTRSGQSWNGRRRPRQRAWSTIGVGDASTPHPIEKRLGFVWPHLAVASIGGKVSAGAMDRRPAQPESVLAKNLAISRASPPPHAGSSDWVPDRVAKLRSPSCFDLALKVGFRHPGFDPGAQPPHQSVASLKCAMWGRCRLDVGWQTTGPTPPAPLRAWCWDRAPGCRVSIRGKYRLHPRRTATWIRVERPLSCQESDRCRRCAPSRGFATSPHRGGSPSGPQQGSKVAAGPEPDSRIAAGVLPPSLRRGMAHEPVGVSDCLSWGSRRKRSGFRSGSRSSSPGL